MDSVFLFLSLLHCSPPFCAGHMVSLKGKFLMGDPPFLHLWAVPIPNESRLLLKPSHCHFLPKAFHDLQGQLSPWGTVQVPLVTRLQSLLLCRAHFFTEPYSWTSSIPSLQLAPEGGWSPRDLPDSYWLFLVPASVGVPWPLHPVSLVSVSAQLCPSGHSRGPERQILAGSNR